MRLVAVPLTLLFSLTLTACPEEPQPKPPDDEVPVAPPHKDPPSPIGVG